MKILTLAPVKMLLLFILLTQIGCELGVAKKSNATTTPTSEQVEHCRKAMCIRPDVEITSLGHCYDHGFQNDSIHFKFTAKTDNISKIFEPEIVAPEKLVPRKTLDPPRYGLADDWWDAAQKALVGGDFIVPDPRTNGDRGLKIGMVKNGDRTCTVYCSWHEP